MPGGTASRTRRSTTPAVDVTTAATLSPGRLKGPETQTISPAAVHPAGQAWRAPGGPATGCTEPSLAITSARTSSPVAREPMTRTRSPEGDHIIGRSEEHTSELQ